MRRLGAFLLAVVFAAIVSAQGTTSRVVGTVTDPTGSAVSNAKVTLKNEATGVSFETTTSEAGAYLFEAIQIGPYSIEVSAPGFRKFVTRGNQLTIGAPMTVNVSLEIGQLVESVEVSAVAEMVQTSTSANIGPVINERTMKEMPIVATRRRDPTSVLVVVPGMNNGTSGTGGGGHMNGARDRAWNFTLDGIDMNEVSAGGGIGNNPIRVNPDSVSEMKIVTSNASAEFGRNSGAQVALVTRSGTNEIHGNAFWFYRTPRLNANTWSNNFNNLGKEMFVQNIYGGSAGGPIIKNKTFYFANWQELRAIRNITSQATVLTKEARQGLFRYALSGRNTPAGAPGASVDAAGNAIVPVGTYNMVANDPLKLGLDPTIKALVDQTPLPNRFDAGDGLNTGGFIFRPTETEKQRDLTFKVDHVLNARNAFNGRIYWGFQNTYCDSVNGGLPRVPGAPCLVNTFRKPRNYAFNWRTNPTATITNEFVAGWSEFWFDFPNPEQDLAKPSISAAYTIPVAYTYNNTRKLKTLQFLDNLSWFRNKHALKFGVNFRLIRHDDDRGSVGGLNSGLEITLGTTNPVDPVAYNIPQAQMNANDFSALRTMVHFNLGIVDQIRQGFVAQGDQFTRGTFQFQSKYNEYDFYVQDSWKLRKNLTLDLGLRLDARMAPVSGVSESILTPNFVPVAGAAPRNNLAWAPGKLWNDDWNNFGPSVGLAWDPFGQGKTSIRTNYRLAYDRVPTFLISGALLPNMPGSTLGLTDATFGASNGRLRNAPALTPTRKPSELRQPIPFSLNTNTVVDPSLETPQTHMWSLGIQQEVAKRTVVEVNYIGRRAHNLLGAYNVNQVEIRKNGFLDAFKVVQAGGQSALFDRIFAADSRLRAGETGADMARRLFGDTIRLGNVGSLAVSLAQRPERGTNLTDASGLGPTFFMPYPQFSGGLNVVDSNDFSTYHSLQLSVNRQFTRGAQVGVSYIWSKSLDTRSYDPALTVLTSGANQSSSSTPLDINNRRLNYGLSNFDRTHSLLSNFVFELPFGRGQRFGANANGVVERIVGGWQVSGLLRATSGYPFSVYSGVLGFNSVVQSFGNCTGCTRSFGNTHFENGYQWYFTPEERAAFSAPAAGEIGNTGRNFFRGPGYFNLDFSLAKKTRLTERFNLELRADVSNLTNTPSFEIPTTTYTSTLFGRIGASLVSSPRQIMLGTKINF